MNLKSILVLLFVPIYGMLCWKYYVCSIKNLCPDSANDTEISIPYPVQFYKNSDAFILGDFDRFADSLAKILPAESLDIVGFFQEGESNPSGFDNLGLARAHVIRELLIHRGLDSNKLGIYGQKQTIDFVDSMAFCAAATPSVKIDLESNDFQLVSHHGMTEIYFPTNSSEEIKSATLVDFFKQMALNNTLEKIILVGHADNHGNEELNAKLSMKRAESIRDQLVKYGVPQGKIVCEGRGSQRPKVNNSTPENRSLNRRVEVITQ